METDKWLSWRGELGRTYINLSSVQKVQVVGQCIRVRLLSGEKFDIPIGAQILTTEDLENTIKFYLG